MASEKSPFGSHPKNVRKENQQMLNSWVNLGEPQDIYGVSHEILSNVQCGSQAGPPAHGIPATFKAPPPPLSADVTARVLGVCGCTDD